MGSQQHAARLNRAQRVYDRYDLLDEACVNLRWAMEALRDGEAGHEDDVAALEEIAAGLKRDRDAARRAIEHIEAQERAAEARDYWRSVL